MPYCSNCGQQLDITAKFCSGCGTPATVQASSGTGKRKNAYEEEIRKCPSCGTVLGTFIVKCPACGSELNGIKVSSVLQNFINEINECERNIANSPAAGKKGWSSWSKKGRFWWVVLNISFLCIPLIIYLALPLITVKSAPELTKEEKRMVSLIENFPFPNDRESILSAMLFVKEKIAFISKETINRKTAYWVRIWGTKAGQIKHKADVLFPNDPIVRKSYNEITADENRVNKILVVKAIIGLVLAIGAILFILVRNGTI